MLIAALSVVFHGAFAVMAHPLKADLTAIAHHDCGGPTKRAASKTSVEAVSRSHHHIHGPHHMLDGANAAPASGDCAHHHHGKVKDANSCCSAVAAAVLPRGQAAEIAQISPPRLRAILAVTGEGRAPPTPSKPPRQTYQS